MLGVALMASSTTYAATAITPGDGVQNLKQGESYTFTGTDNYYVNSSFFTKNADGTYTFRAVNGTYQIQANNDLKYLQVRPTKADGSLATLQSDGTGAVWIIGNGIGFPTVSDNQVGWTTDKAIAMAQVGDLTYEIKGVVGKEFGSTIDFKFFGQAGWGIEFKGSAGSDYAISTTKGILNVGTGSNGHDDGNLFLSSDANLSMGDTVTVNLDLTMGVQAAALTTTVSKSSTKFEPTINGEKFMNTPYGYAWVGTLTQGQHLVFANADAFKEADWYMDPDFFEKDGDGYKFLPVTGYYAVLADFSLKYFKVFEVTDAYLPVSYDKTTGKGNIWVIGSTGIGKPSYAKNGHNWYTGYTNDIPLAKITDTKYRLTLNAGKEVDLTDNTINFKFFAQPDWGTEFNSDPSITLAGDYASYFTLNGGNVNFAKSNTDMTEAEKALVQSIKTLVFTLDVTNPAAAVLNIDVKLNTSAGISALRNGGNSRAPWYTIDGKRLAKKPSVRGLYIHEGKKFVVK